MNGTALFRLVVFIGVSKKHTAKDPLEADDGHELRPSSLDISTISYVLFARLKLAMPRGSFTPPNTVPT